MKKQEWKFPLVRDSQKKFRSAITKKKKKERKKEREKRRTLFIVISGSLP